MQLFALDETGRLILADHATRQKDYVCRECKQLVRVRRGPHKRAHFFHNEPLRTCSQHGKSLEHLQVQRRLEELLKDQCSLERRFDAIGRIADVCWEKRKIIFEVQCSPISVTEVQKRTADYRGLGYTVVWILHDHYFGQRMAKAAEEWLHGHLCYFTDINREGEGVFYDRCSILHSGYRMDFGSKMRIELHQPKQKIALRGNLPELLHKRLQQTDLCFEGDLFHADPSLLDRVYREEKLRGRYSWLLKGQQYLERFIVQPYKALMRLLLEKYCE